MIEVPTQPSAAKNAMTSTCAAMLKTRRRAGLSCSISSGQPMWARFAEASAERG